MWIASVRPMAITGTSLSIFHDCSFYSVRRRFKVIDIRVSSATAQGQGFSIGAVCTPMQVSCAISDWFHEHSIYSISSVETVLSTTKLVIQHCGQMSIDRRKTIVLRFKPVGATREITSCKNQKLFALHKPLR